MQITSLNVQIYLPFSLEILYHYRVSCFQPVCLLGTGGSTLVPLFRGRRLGSSTRWIRNKLADWPIRAGADQRFAQSGVAAAQPEKLNSADWHFVKSSHSPSPSSPNFSQQLYVIRIRAQLALTISPISPLDIAAAVSPSPRLSLVHFCSANTRLTLTLSCFCRANRRIRVTKP